MKTQSFPSSTEQQVNVRIKNVMIQKVQVRFNGMLTQVYNILKRAIRRGNVLE